MHMEQGSDSVEFYVGALSEKLPAKQFIDIPICKSNACRGGASVESMRQKNVDGVGNWMKDKVCRCFYLAITLC
ncbi:hypothetical protein RchiOBHm_Chr5g0082141 [Rosa chinensis]|uniref:Uncharacterized protein n=1 Tax=Rosa chinensis TaxID=74649 RepID=A0A2P6QN82_ROSCH|nr:hypothetical protein RchiOBHm_Chr5g0082141 [Rosa chinensis]